MDKPRFVTLILFLRKIVGLRDKDQQNPCQTSESPLNGGLHLMISTGFQGDVHMTALR